MKILKRIQICLLVLCLLYLSVHAGVGSQLSGYFETGKRTTTEDYEEEDTDDEYTYRNYHLKYINENQKNLKYELSTFQKVRDYKEIDALDNWSAVYKGKCVYDFKEGKAETLQSGIELKHKTKRFDDSPINEYDQVKVAPFLTKALKDKYRVTIKGGMDNYDYKYAGEKDEDTLYGRIKGNRYFNDKRLNLTSSYKISNTKRKKTFKERTIDSCINKILIKAKKKGRGLQKGT